MDFNHCWVKTVRGFSLHDRQTAGTWLGGHCPPTIVELGLGIAGGDDWVGQRIFVNDCVVNDCVVEIEPHSILTLEG